jgi:hypothetical protein
MDYFISPHIYAFRRIDYPEAIFLAIVNNSAMNMGVKISVKIVILFALGVYPEVELLDYIIILFLIFKGTSIVFSIVAGSIYSPTNRV